MQFNNKPPQVMHLDLNSAFATIEQQARPHLREKPVVVAAYDSPGGCILAASIEAKKYGLKTGMRVREGRELCPNLVVLLPDPAKYRDVHLKLRRLLVGYTPVFSPKSIDEFVLDFKYAPKTTKSLPEIGREIKRRIKAEIGDWLRVSIGLGPNRFLAKTASNLKKPDGLETIDKNNFLSVYKRLLLTDLNGISKANKMRLNLVGIGSVLDFYDSPLWKLKAAFSSIAGYYWFLRLRGFEIDNVDFSRRSFGNSYAFPYSQGGLPVLLPVLQKLAEKTGRRLRASGHQTSGIHLSLSFKDKKLWHKGESLKRAVFDSRDIFKEAKRILGKCPFLTDKVHVLSLSCFKLQKGGQLQLSLLEPTLKKKNLIEAFDVVNQKWGDFSLAPAGLLKLKRQVQDRIAFGGVKDLQSL